MKFFKKYYEDVCKKRHQELKKSWAEVTPVSYRGKDIVREVLDLNKKM